MKEAIKIQRGVAVKWQKREDIYPMLGPGGVGVEIGVRVGENARNLYERAKPDTLYLVDPWNGELKHWRPFGTRKEQPSWDKNYQTTLAAFGKEIAEKRVVVCRHTGEAMRDVFPFESVSWVYVDGNHMLAHAFMDLYYYYRRVKPGGYLLAHDFCDEVSNGNVVLAVDLLRRIYPGIEILGRSAEVCSTVVMRIGQKEELHWF